MIRALDYFRPIPWGRNQFLKQDCFLNSTVPEMEQNSILWMFLAAPFFCRILVSPVAERSNSPLFGYVAPKKLPTFWKKICLHLQQRVRGVTSQKTVNFLLLSSLIFVPSKTLLPISLSSPCFPSTCLKVFRALFFVLWQQLFLYLAQCQTQ